MSQDAKALAEKLQAFNDRLLAAVERIPDAQWKTITAAEDWPVCVVAHHVGAGHYTIRNWAEKILAGEALPEMSWDEVNRMANAHAEKHADCTREEVMATVKDNGKALVDYVAGLSDEAFNRKTASSLFGGEVSVGQLIEGVVLQSAGGHLESIENTIATSAHR